MRHLARALVPLLLAGSITPAAADGGGQQNDPRDVQEVLDAAIRRDKDYSSPVTNKARVKKAGAWQDVEESGSFFHGPDDDAEDAVRKQADVSEAVSVRGTRYASTSWSNVVHTSKAKPARQPRPDRAEVVADLPVGTPIDVSLDRERLTLDKIGIIVGAQTDAIVNHGVYHDADHYLAPANPRLPRLRVTRRDRRVPAGEARLHASQTSLVEHRGVHRRTTQISRGVVKIRGR